MNYNKFDFSQFAGKELARIVLDPDYNGGDGGLILEFADGTGFTIYDDGRSCCEHRYLHTDDDLSGAVGEEFRSVEVINHIKNPDGGYGVHEMAFLILRTDWQTFTIETHNRHNGYYGGFCMNINIDGEKEEEEW